MRHLRIHFSWSSTKNNPVSILSVSNFRSRQARMTSDKNCQLLRHSRSCFWALKHTSGQALTWGCQGEDRRVGLWSETSRSVTGLPSVRRGDTGRGNLELWDPRAVGRNLCSLPQSQRGSDRCLSSWRYRRPFPAGCSSARA